MPVKKDAEAVTEAPEASPAIGNVEASELGATQALVLKQNEMIKKLAAKIDQLEQRTENVPQPPAQQIPLGPPPLAEGAKRYYSRYTEQTLMRVGTGHEMHGGVAVPVPIITGKSIDFNGGVYETSDPDEIEFLDTHAEYGQTFWEDSSAVKRHSQVEVQDGLRSTEQSPRVPLAAPMGH
jgi:hypothetical protein